MGMVNDTEAFFCAPNRGFRLNKETKFDVTPLVYLGHRGGSQSIGCIYFLMYVVKVRRCSLVVKLPHTK